MIVPFDAKFTPHDADFRPFIKDELCEQSSMEYLILLGLQGVKRVLGNAQFTTSTRVQGQLDEYEQNNNPIIGFIQELGLDGIDRGKSHFHSNLSGSFFQVPQQRPGLRL